jgi:hypothetical protein
MRVPLVLFYPILNLFPLAENIKRGKRKNSHDVSTTKDWGQGQSSSVQFTNSATITAKEIQNNGEIRSLW